MAPGQMRVALTFLKGMAERGLPVDLVLVRAAELFLNQVRREARERMRVKAYRCSYWNCHYLYPATTPCAPWKVASPPIALVAPSLPATVSNKR